MASKALHSPATLLLCHHGTRGAAAAEALALEFAVPGVTTIVHCLVVPELWAGMQGDDWLNDASTRDAFGGYVENLLENDAQRELAAVEARCQERSIGYRAVMRYGEPVEIVLAIAVERATPIWSSSARRAEKAKKVCVRAWTSRSWCGASMSPADRATALEH